MLITHLRTSLQLLKALSAPAHQVGQKMLLGMLAQFWAEH